MQDETNPSAQQSLVFYGKVDASQELAQIQNGDPQRAELAQLFKPLNQAA